MRLKTKIVLSFTFIVLMITSFTALVSIYREKSILKSELKIQGTLLAQNMADHAVKAFIVDNYVPLIGYINVLSKRRNVTYINIRNKKGKILADSKLQLIGSVIKDKSLKYLKNHALHIQLVKDKHKEDIYKIEVPILINKKLYGVVDLGYSMENLEKKFRSIELNILLLTILGSVLAIIFSFFLTNLITGPLKQLKHVTNEISKGNFDIELDIHSNDEIGEVADAFRKMAKELNKNINNLLDTKKLLIEEKEKLLITLNSINDCVITINDKKEIIFINPAAKLFINDYKKFIGNTLDNLPIFKNLGNQNLSLTDIADETIKTSRTIQPVETYKITNSKGKIYFISITCTPIKSQDNKVIGAVIVIRDITDKRRLQEEQLKSQKLESIGLLAGGIAHDFNNILTGIVGNITLAKLFAENNKKIIERLEAAESASMQAKDLTHQLLTFSKGGAPVKTTSCISNILKENVEFALHGSSVTYKLEVESNLWNVNVDVSQFSQVINNLIINASQAMPTGGIVSITAQNVVTNDNEVPGMLSGEYVKIIITDQGVGIPNKHINRIFDPYFTTKEQGNGLGLAIVYSIITRHDGYITVMSEPGKGTSFTIYLPAAKNNNINNTHKTSKPNHKHTSWNILVMDDEKIVRDVAKRMLIELGHNVVTCKNGQEMLQKYQQAAQNNRPFDAVIMDLTIAGGMGGLEAIKKLKKLYPHAKAIASSGYSDDLTVSQYKKYGFVGIIAKPYKLEEFQKILEEILTTS